MPVTQNNNVSEPYNIYDSSAYESASKAYMCNVTASKHNTNFSITLKQVANSTLLWYY